MTMETTLGIIKPDCVSKNNIGAIIECIESKNLKIVGLKMLHLSIEQAQQFYQVHAERGFFNDLVTFMSSGPVTVMAIRGENAVASYRAVMGATNPVDADQGTIRAEFADSIDANAVHGSDSLENAKIELEFFFNPGAIMET